MSTRVVGPSARCAIVGIALVIGSGCAPFAHLGPVTRGGEVATGTDVQSVRVIRGGATVADVKVGMALKKADEISTSDGTRAVVTFRAGYEVILDNATTITIENPSIFVRLGQAFIRSLFGPKRSTDSLPVSAGTTSFLPEGTQFVVSVPDRDRVVVSVLEGFVAARSKTRAWPPTRYGPLEQGTIIRGQPPQRVRRLDDAEANVVFGWVREVDRLTSIQVPRLVGQPERRAKQQLEAMGLKVQVRYATTGNQQPGNVAGQDPESGRPLHRGDRVSLTVESQPIPAPTPTPVPVPTPSITVPRVVGHQASTAKDEIERASLRVASIVYSADSSVPRNAVISTRPSVGSPVERNQRVTLLVRGCVVPLLGPKTTPQDAPRLIQEAGLRSAPPGKGDYVKSQKPKANTIVACGSTVSFDTDFRVRH